MNTSPEQSEPTWLSLSEAADLLDVHFTTLRRWADQGKIAHIRTPGGRRRFARSDVRNFLQQRLQGIGTTQTLSPQRALATRQPGRLDLNLEQESWMDKFGDLERIRLKGIGQMMMGYLMQYNARSENNHLYLEEARQIAVEVGSICASAQMTAREVVTAFLVFRSTIVEMMLNSSAVQNTLDEEGRLLHRRTNEYMDAILVAIITGFSEERGA